MNREFTSTTKLGRSIFAFAAVVTTVLILSGITGLAEHYGSATQLAAGETIQDQA
jgi:hypothetical protein